MKRALCTGSSGFIGGHLCKYLRDRKIWVKGVDIKRPEWGNPRCDEFQQLDLTIKRNCEIATAGDFDEVYHLAANMGGIGYIHSHKVEIARDNTLINVNMLEACRRRGVKKFLFTSSACVYPIYLQDKPDVKPLKETDAYPADAEDGYGWEKLYAERLCRHYLEDYGVSTYVARFHNIYGPLGTFEGGKEKAPAALCRKIAKAKSEDEIEVWGNGKQTRSFCYIDDCVDGIYNLMQSDHHKPINIGTDRLVTIDELIDIIAKIAGKKVKKKYLLDKTQGVRGRNADISLIKKVLGWDPEITLEQGLETTYNWINSMVNKGE